ncbi:MAG: ADP-ribosylation factor protein 3 [Chaenotheca gracillima]|nr:MAG: ADP-ribosylation factor protein 3 [Chaenotheca gracillima]
MGNKSKETKSTVSLSQLSTSDLDALTNVLRVSFTENLSPFERSSNSGTFAAESQATVTDLIKHLPPHLLRASSSASQVGGWHGRIVAFFARKRGDGRAAAPLCKVHKALEPHLIRSIFSAHVAEISIRLNDLIAYHTSPSAGTLPSHLEALIARLRAIHALWVPPDIYKDCFFKDPHPKWKFQADGCEACMLARIGGDLLTVLDLRVAAASRRSSRRMKHFAETGQRPPARLWRWVDSLVGWNGRYPDIERHTQKDVKALRRARRAARFEVKGKTTSHRSSRPKQEEVKRKTHRSSKERSTSISTHSRTSAPLANASPTMSSTTGSRSKTGSSLGTSEEGDKEDDNDDGNHSDEEGFEEKIIDYYAGLASVRSHHSKRETVPLTASLSIIAESKRPWAQFSADTVLIVDGLVHPAARPASSIYPEDQVSNPTWRKTAARHTVVAASRPATTISLFR